MKKSKQMRRLGTSLIVAGVMMIAAALGLVIYNKVQSDTAGNASEAAILELESIMFNNQMNGVTDDVADDATWHGLQ
ncbi:MAG: hypothetical protein IJE07_03820 [Clostridia bacterium]|nr:hypothetical protein [Clostridia bacterium]